jgi:phosphopantetheine--protein transferase-like protein
LDLVTTIADLKAEIEGSLLVTGLEIKLHHDWGSHAPSGTLKSGEFRQEIRKDLATRLSEPALLDLERLPNPPSHLVSISHCHVAGGYALAARSTVLRGIGFDIEEVSRFQSPRIKPGLLERITTPRERINAASLADPLAFLWCAKEAAFKSFQDTAQAVVFTELEVNFAADQKKFTAFHTRAQTQVRGQGLVWSKGDLIFGFFAQVT